MQIVWRPTGSLTSRMRKLIGMTVLSAVLAGGLLSTAYVYIDHSARLRGQLGRAALAYQNAAATAASLDDADAARAVIDLTATTAAADSARIVGINGGVLAKHEPSVDGGPTGGLAAMLLPSIDVALPLEIDYQPVGTLELSVSRAPVVYALGLMLLVQAAALGVALLVAIAITRRMRETISRPIQGLLETMERVAEEKDYSLSVQPDGPDEIGSLIISFNDMLSQIRGRDEHLAEHRRQLQELVIERTRNLESAAKEAEHSSRAKGDFLARMSHEIRTPMNGVVGMAELLQNTRLDTRQLQMLHTMRSSADALLEIINDILDFSKIEAGRLQVTSEDFAVVDLIEEVCDLLAARAQERGLELVCRVDMKVPAWCNGDPLRFRQVLTNLLGNAIKYTQQGHVAVHAVVTGEEERGFRLRIAVTDTGLGIPEEEIENVFEAFTQVDSFETRKHGGTGLGLAITRQLVDLLGGDVGVSSKLGQGSTFWFELPLAHAARAPKQEAPWSIAAVPILLVQDHEAAAQAITELLEAAGASVVRVNTGGRAMERLALAGPFEAVIVDHALPDTSGAEFLERLRTSGLPAVPVIMLTPVVTAGNDEVTCEPDEWLPKPVRRARLAEAVDHALGRADPSRPRSGAARGSAIRRLGLDVLLVEDSPVNQEVACGMLDALGCRVVCAGDGTLGVEHALGRHFDVVLMDCQMPLMDGFEATRKIRTGEVHAERSPVPIVAITANALPGDRERCLAAGMTDFISKPFTLRKLQAVMQAVTGVPGDHTGVDAPREKNTDTGDLPVIEVGRIEELRSLGRPQIVRQAILLFLKQAAQKLDELDVAVQRAELPGMEQAAHALKSSSLSVGGRRFAAAAGDCEDAARGGDAGAARSAARRLRPEFRVLCRALSALAQADERAA
jgi:signal transduction histidine kinase/CheY-like chemotaxis protein/HPt (histidine-containing phosphotransfer) domain-containing protein